MSRSGVWLLLHLWRRLQSEVEGGLRRAVSLAGGEGREERSPVELTHLRSCSRGRVRCAWQ